MRLFKDGKCSIHAEKPHECKIYDHTLSSEDVDKNHEAVAMEWKDHQDEVERLLGCKPSVDVFESFLHLRGFLGYGYEQ